MIDLISVRQIQHPQPLAFPRTYTHILCVKSTVILTRISACSPYTTSTPQLPTAKSQEIMDSLLLVCLDFVLVFNENGPHRLIARATVEGSVSLKVGKVRTHQSLFNYLLRVAMRSKLTNTSETPLIQLLLSGCSPRNVEDQSQL